MSAYYKGHFAANIGAAVEDARAGDFELTRLVADILESIEPLAVECARVETGEVSGAYTIVAACRQFPEIHAALQKLGAFLLPFRQVAEVAIKAEAERRRQMEG